ncbi:MAG: hypothetical protein ACRD5M_12475 [Candidatus Acidiferrales bacterium]
MGGRDRRKKNVNAGAVEEVKGLFEKEEVDGDDVGRRTKKGWKGGAGEK